MSPERGRGRTTRRLGAALAAALLVGACTGGAEPPSGVEASPNAPVPAGAEAPQRQIQDFLEERAEQLTAGDVRAYLEPVVREGRDLERRIARGTTQVPLARIHLLLVRAEPEGEAFPGTEVEFIYRYRGMPPDNVFRFRVVYDLLRRGDGWRIVAARRAGRLPPWVTGPVEIERSKHFMAMFRPGLEEVDRALQTAERARDALHDRLTLAPDARHLIVLAGNFHEYEGAVGPETGAASAAATLLLYGSRAGTTTRAENRHIVVNLEAVDRWAGPAATRHGWERTAGAVFRHELAHLLLAPHTAPWTPGWVMEGSAMYLAEDEWTDVWRRGLDAGVFEDTSVIDLSELERLRDAYAYAYAHAAVLHLVDRFGEDRFWEFYRGFAQLSGAPARGARETTRLLRIVYGISASELDRGALERIRGSA